MNEFANIVQWISNPEISRILIYVLIGYLALLWISLVIWTTKDIISRTNNFLLQIISILLVLILNIFGLLVYFAIRPSRTLVERFFEELEYEALISESKKETTKKVVKKKRGRPPKKEKDEKDKKPRKTRKTKARKSTKKSK